MADISGSKRGMPSSRRHFISRFQVGLLEQALWYRTERYARIHSNYDVGGRGVRRQSENHSLDLISGTRSFPEPWTKKSLRFPKARNSIFFWESLVSVPM